MIKRIIALFLVLAAAVTACVLFPVEAQAAELIKYKITYGSGKVVVTLTPSSKNNDIYFTTNGKKPTEDSKEYSKKIAFSKETTLRAIEVNSKNKTVATIKMTVAPRTDKVSVKVEKMLGKSTIKLTAEDKNTKIYYTTDGSKPTDKSKLYTKPFTVKKNCTVKAAAYKKGFKESEIVSEKIKIFSLDEKSVYENMVALKSKYPTGKKWNNDNYYKWRGGIYSGGYGCAGFAFMLSDAAFGNLKARKHTDFDNIKVGDILRINNDTHSVIVLKISGNTYTIAEGNFNNGVYWGRTFSKSDIKKIGNFVLTRYPEK